MSAQGSALGDGKQSTFALKGQKKTNRTMILPFRAVLLLHLCPQGVARGWHINAPSGRREPNVQADMLSACAEYEDFKSLYSMLPDSKSGRTLSKGTRSMRLAPPQPILRQAKRRHIITPSGRQPNSGKYKTRKQEVANVKVKQLVLVCNKGQIAMQ
jgi:hypothetical protein